MTLKLDILASGQLPTTEGTLYLTPLGKEASARIHLVNTSLSSIVKVNVLVQNGTGTARRIMPRNLELGPQEAAKSDYVELGGTDSIRGFAGASSLVDYSVTGILRT